MLKKFFTVFLVCVLFILPFSGCKEKDGLKTVELNEVTHSVFYAPLYVAIENGYFEEENLLPFHKMISLLLSGILKLTVKYHLY